MDCQRDRMPSIVGELKKQSFTDIHIRNDFLISIAEKPRLYETLPFNKTESWNCFETSTAFDPQWMWSS